MWRSESELMELESEIERLISRCSVVREKVDEVVGDVEMMRVMLKVSEEVDW